MGVRRPRRRYNRNVELLLGIVVIVLVVVLLVWLIAERLHTYPTLLHIVLPTPCLSRSETALISRPKAQGCAPLNMGVQEDLFSAVR